ncbi:hypothetical protein [Rhodococcus sp. ARC_M6]|uniref:hypothetical protein n=1 Tax=Rhodococcus sp. ARC_M6 TaxID=2928852 RepID=UPI001FB250FA|nr:hypothetical protein [Rhodococcus sp. ARC_M6]MCJ0906232.1 hypothetical protein [Rhodococcus sp. ARC_M6]
MTAPLSPLIMVEDVQNRLGETFDDTERLQVESLIDFASARLRAYPLDIDARIAQGSLSSVLVTGVLVTAVARAVDAIKIGLRVRSEQYPEISTTYSDVDPSLIYFSPADLELLDPSVGVKFGGAFSIVPG